MCLQDYRMAMRTRADIGSVQCTSGVVVQIVKGNAQRLRLIVTLSGFVNLSVDESIQIGIRAGAVIAPLAIIDNYHKSVVIEVAELCSDAVGELWAYASAAADKLVRYVDISLDTTAEEAATEPSLI